MFELDHIVITAEDPASAAKAFAAKYHVKTMEGGRHEKWGTYNHLANFANDCYIEWIGIFDETTAANSDNPLIHQVSHALKQHLEGPVQFALRTQDMDHMVQHFQNSSIRFTGPIPGSRQKPDGSMLNWKMLFPEAESGVLPFLIEWGDGKNMPEDEQLINQRSIASVTYPQNLEVFRQVFRGIQLENSHLHLTGDNKMDFSLE
ncbi:VOC family protein [Lentibacillus sediminis]|uniref:VOC family protein n=1 Tax=Lentibacillus sediminis TaxID=1940529 RepID=UPI001304795C|nr:VOC family protein [Lentibacillus sediminis]